MIRVNAQSRNRISITLFMLLLALKVTMEFISTVLGCLFGISSTSAISIGLYMAFIVYTLYKIIVNRSIKVGSLLFVIGVYFLIAITWFFSNNRAFYFDQTMLLNYLVFIPFSGFVVLSISDWNELFDVAPKYVYICSLLCLLNAVISVVFKSSRMTTNTSYMGYSYTLLPIICLSYLLYKHQRDKKSLFICAACFVSMLIYGARMPIFLFLLYFVLCNIREANNWKRMIYIFLLLLVGVFFEAIMKSELLYSVMSALGSKYGAHISNEFFKGNLFASAGREQIYEIIKQAIGQMPFSGMGMFADRAILGGSSYSHSIILESVLSLGWFWSVVFLGMLLILFIKAFSKSFIDKTQSIYLLFFVSFFCKLFVSSSFIGEWGFYVFLGIVFSYIDKNRKWRLIK